MEQTKAPGQRKNYPVITCSHEGQDAHGENRDTDDSRPGDRKAHEPPPLRLCRGRELAAGEIPSSRSRQNKRGHEHKSGPDHETQLTNHPDE